MENKRLSLIRTIKIYTGNFEGFEDSWNEIIEKIPDDLLKHLTIAVKEFFKYKSFMRNVSPLQIATEKGNFELCKFIIGMIQGSNLANGKKKTSKKGILGFYKLFEKEGVKRKLDIIDEYTPLWEIQNQKECMFASDGLKSKQVINNNNTVSDFVESF